MFYGEYSGAVINFGITIHLHNSLYYYFCIEIPADTLYIDVWDKIYFKCTFQWSLEIFIRSFLSKFIDEEKLIKNFKTQDDKILVSTL